jgi:putative transposase
LITRNGHAGLEAARKAMFPSGPWQCCQFHLQQKASPYVTRLEQRKEVAAGLQAVFNAPSRGKADHLLAMMLKKYITSAPRLSQWLEAHVYQKLAVMNFPAEHQKRLRMPNLSGRVNHELKRRTRVLRVFPNAASLLRLVMVVLIEIDEDWQSCTCDLRFS